MLSVRIGWGERDFSLLSVLERTINHSTMTPPGRGSGRKVICRGEKYSESQHALQREIWLWENEDRSHTRSWTWLSGMEKGSLRPHKGCWIFQLRFASSKRKSCHESGLPHRQGTEASDPSNFTSLQIASGVTTVQAASLKAVPNVVRMPEDSIKAAWKAILHNSIVTKLLPNKEWYCSGSDFCQGGKNLGTRSQIYWKRNIVHYATQWTEALFHLAVWTNKARKFLFERDGSSS